jgi:hypothetical protein
MAVGRFVRLAVTSELAWWYLSLSESSPHIIDSAGDFLWVTDTGAMDETVVSPSFDDHAASQPRVDLPREDIKGKGQNRRPEHMLSRRARRYVPRPTVGIRDRRLASLSLLHD